MNKIYLMIFICFLSYSFKAEELSLLTDGGRRVGFDGTFGPIILELNLLQGYSGGYLFGRDFYESNLYIDTNYSDPSYFELPEEILNEGIVLGSEYFESGTWHSRREGPFDFLYLESSSDYTYRERLGLLVHARKLFLYDGNFLLFASDEGLRWSGYNPRVTAVQSSSALQEGERRYSGGNSILFTSDEYLPWAEGAAGNGIGEWFEIETESEAWPVDFLLVSNGYVDFTRPELFRQNGRIRRMRIDIPEHSMSFEAELADTPQFQEVRLPRRIGDGDTIIRLTVLAVYPGSRWEDTCLNLVIPMGDRPD